MELPQNMRAVFDALETISVNVAGFRDDESWQTFNLTRAEYDKFFDIIGHSSLSDLFDCWNSIRHDFSSRHSLLTLRLPSFPQALFVGELQDHISKALFMHANAGPHNWFLEHIIGVNAERGDNADSLVYGAWHPDLAYYFSPNHTRPARARAAAAAGTKRSRHSWECDPTLLIDVGNNVKHDDMAALAPRYAGAGNGATRTVVSIDTTRGVYSVWRYLRYLPTAVDGREWRRCFLTEKDVAWRGTDGPGLVLSIRDFMPTTLPLIEGTGDDDMEALMKKTVQIDCATLTKMWEKASAPPPVLDDGSTDMELSETEVATDEDEPRELPDDEDDDEKAWEDLMAEIEEQLSEPEPEPEVQLRRGGVANVNNWMAYHDGDAAEDPEGEDADDEDDDDEESEEE
ncbi:hypothetical protein SLS58_009196 [Diplodia intermedia]|uniref:Uncharacterized protein n=1 Tax=Diplodia intermedia TaxID=856260 RepID=A0ABR3TE54_9PEZI